MGEYACSQLRGLKAHVLITAEQSIINPVLEYQILLRLGLCEGILKRPKTEIISFRMTHCQIKHFSHYPFLSLSPAPSPVPGYFNRKNRLKWGQALWSSEFDFSEGSVSGAVLRVL